MQDYNDFTENHSHNHKNKPCFFIWRILLAIGATLTFIRNFISNIVMLLVILVIYLAISFANDLQDKIKEIGDSFAGPQINVETKAPILYFPLRGYIQEMPFSQSKLEMIQRQLDEALNGNVVHELIAIEKSLKDVVNDKDIKAIFLDLSSLRGLSLSNANRLGKILDSIKESGKKVICYALSYSQNNYALAAHASQIYLDPLGSVNIQGVSLSSLYYKDLLDKLYLTPYIFKEGTFKSAVEPYMQNYMSYPVKREYQEIAENSFKLYEDSVKNARVALKNAIILPDGDNYIAKLKQFNGDIALMQKDDNLLDEIASLNDVYIKLAKEYGQSTDSKFVPNVIDYRDYNALNFRLKTLNTIENNESDTLEQVAVVYGIGTIVDEPQSPDSFAPANIIPILNNIRDSNTYKGVILYLNSPGGSAIASEKIRRALAQVRESGKKVVVFMSGTAASGAYWIATESDKIIATKATLTGSIGVFAVGIGVHKLLNHFGVYQDGVATHEFAKNYVGEEMSNNVKELSTLSVKATYQKFLNLVAKSRNLNINDYQTYAEGQVFLADKAKSLGLIDNVGDLETATKEMAKLLQLGSNKLNLKHLSYQNGDDLNKFEEIFFSASYEFFGAKAALNLLDIFKEVKENEPFSQNTTLMFCPIESNLNN